MSDTFGSNPEEWVKQRLIKGVAFCSYCGGLASVQGNGLSECCGSKVFYAERRDGNREDL